MGNGASGLKSAKKDKETSNKSTEVTVFKLSSAHNEVETSSNTNEENTEIESISKYKLQLLETATKMKCLEQEKNEAQEQVASLSSKVLDLEEQIQLLQERLDSYAATSNSGNDYAESFKLKEKQIEKFEEDIRAMTTSMEKMRKLHKKKIRSVNTKLVIAQNEHALECSEMNAEIQKLREENESLRSRGNDGQHQDAESSWSEVIKSLSVKISDQADKITELQNQIHHKDKEIATLINNSAKPPSAKHLPSPANTHLLNDRASYIWESSKVRTASGRSRDSGMDIDSGLNKMDSGINCDYELHDDLPEAFQNGAFMTEITEDRDNWLSSEDELQSDGSNDNKNFDTSNLRIISATSPYGHTASRGSMNAVKVHYQKSGLPVVDM